MSMFSVESPGAIVGTAATSRADQAYVGLLVWQLSALAGQVSAVVLARHGNSGVAEPVSNASLAVAFGSALWVLTRPQLSLVTRNIAVVCLGVTPTLMWRATNPLLFTGFDEQLHMRTLGDIISSRQLFSPNPLLEVSARYPGLEALAALVHQLGVPTMASALFVVLSARIVLVSVLCDAVEQLTGSIRAGGLAVAVYAVSPQFVFFNSQFSYQTLALPLALAAVSLIARARQSDRPVPLLAGATVCLIGLAMTHHVTGFIAMTFLVLWTAAERGPARLRVAFGALAAIACTLAWAMLQSSLLEDYFGPIVDDVRSQFSGGIRRKVFKDSAGTAATLFDQFILLYYAAAVSFVVLTLAVLTLRWWRRGDRRVISGPRLLVLMLASLIPVLLAARVVPKGGELFDRGSSTLFLALSLVVARYAVRLWWQPDRPLVQSRRSLMNRGAAVVLASGVFVGGYVLGSGPNWARLPGPYMAAADTRSMDAETLAAVDWAGQELPEGSRIGADRVSSVLLAAKAGLWPVMKGGGHVDVAALYVANRWGMTETDIAAGMRLRYLYVDRRLAAERPHFGSYFFNGETGGGKQLTDAQLTKFAAVQGITTIYRHGPVSIYDLKKLGVPELRSGWYRVAPGFEVTHQVIPGLIAGLLFAWMVRRGLWPKLMAGAQALLQRTGIALTSAIAMSAACLLSATLLMADIPMTPVVIASAALIVAIANPRAILPLVRQSKTAVPWRAARTVAWVAIPLAAVITVAVRDDAGEDITGVEQILDDPAAVHISAGEPGR